MKITKFFIRNLFVAIATIILSLDFLSTVTAGKIPGLEDFEISHNEISKTVSSCGGFVTKEVQPGQPGQQHNFTEGNWREFLIKHQNETITEIIVNSRRVVRFCNPNNCTIYKESIKLKEEHAVKFIQSAICSTKKSCNSTLNHCADVELKPNECARFYQAESCNDCQFDHISILKKDPFDLSHHNLKYETVESFKVAPGCNASITYMDCGSFGVRVQPLETEGILWKYAWSAVSISCGCSYGSYNN